jgi:hypothetical protein
MFKTSGYFDSIDCTKKCSNVDLLSDVLVLLSWKRLKRKKSVRTIKTHTNGQRRGKKILKEDRKMKLTALISVSYNVQ